MMATSNEELLKQDPGAVNIENTEGDERVIAMVSLAPDGAHVQGREQA